MTDYARDVTLGIKADNNTNTCAPPSRLSGTLVSCLGWLWAENGEHLKTLPFLIRP